MKKMPRLCLHFLRSRLDMCLTRINKKEQMDNFLHFLAPESVSLETVSVYYPPETMIPPCCETWNHLQRTKATVGNNRCPHGEPASAAG